MLVETPGFDLALAPKPEKKHGVDRFNQRLCTGTATITHAESPIGVAKSVLSVEQSPGKRLSDWWTDKCDLFLSS